MRFGLCCSPKPTRSSPDRRISRQKSAIKALASDLGFKFSNPDVADLYDQLDTTIAAYEPPVQPCEEFETLSQSWLLDELILVGLNLIVGMPGAGKSRLIVALIRAYLNGQETFVGRKLMSGVNRSVLIIGTDQDRQQWGALLAEQGLATVIKREVIDGQEHFVIAFTPPSPCTPPVVASALIPMGCVQSAAGILITLAGCPSSTHCPLFCPLVSLKGTKPLVA